MAPSTSAVILIIEDHELTRRFLSENLRADRYVTLEASSIAHARRLLLSSEPSVVILDLELPDGDGLNLLGELRGADGPCSGMDPNTPVLILSGRASEVQRVRGLNRGADDYLPKPFSYPELRARIEALLRRRTRQPGLGRTRVATLEVDPRSREVWLEGALVHLSGKEFGLVRMLASEPTRTFTRDELLREVWGYETPGITTRTLDTHAHRVRRKLCIGEVRFIVNVWGVGYRLCDSEVLA